jgi:mRNA-degrading endonuclease RelE of RelBE toxin-antitoxin system
VLHPTTKRKVRAAIEAIRETPELGDELTRELSGLRRLRIGRLRPVYRLQGRQIQIVALGPRATTYLDLSAQRRKR